MTCSSDCPVGLFNVYEPKEIWFGELCVPTSFQDGVWVSFAFPDLQWINGGNTFVLDKDEMSLKCVHTHEETFINYAWIDVAGEGKTLVSFHNNEYNLRTSLGYYKVSDVISYAKNRFLCQLDTCQTTLDEFENTHYLRMWNPMETCISKGPDFLILASEKKVDAVYHGEKLNPETGRIFKQDNMTFYVSRHFCAANYEQDKWMLGKNANVNEPINIDCECRIRLRENHSFMTFPKLSLFFLAAVARLFQENILVEDRESDATRYFRIIKHLPYYLRLHCIDSHWKPDSLDRIYESVKLFVLEHDRLPDLYNHAYSIGMLSDFNETQIDDRVDRIDPYRLMGRYHRGKRLIYPQFL